MSFTDKELVSFYVSNLDVRLLGQFRVQHIERAYLEGLKEGRSGPGVRSIQELVLIQRYVCLIYHYEERITMKGTKPPGILTEAGQKARKAIKWEERND
jgi:hypothetical protein